MYMYLCLRCGPVSDLMFPEIHMCVKLDPSMRSIISFNFVSHISAQSFCHSVPADAAAHIMCRRSHNGHNRLKFCAGGVIHVITNRRSVGHKILPVFTLTSGYRPGIPRPRTSPKCHDSSNHVVWASSRFSVSATTWLTTRQNSCSTKSRHR